MKKGILYSSIFGIGLLLLSLVIFNTSETKEFYTPRQHASSNDGIRGAAEWLHRIRANQVTGEVNPKDVLRAREQVMALGAMSKKSSIGLQWTEMGPDNIGGRTRAYLIDNTDPKIMYAGSVSGGLFKTTNGGASWSQVNDHQSNLAVTCIAQAPNGDIYYGTGEDMYYPATGNGSSGLIGGGMFKSTDGGSTFTLLPDTKPVGNDEDAPWASIGKIVIDPVNSNIIYAATNVGLKISQDAGATWTNAPGTPSGEATDMTITPSGVVWVKAGVGIYKSNGTPSSFTEITVSPVNAPADKIKRSGARMRIAVSPQDENYVYVVSVTPGISGGHFDKAYRSTDGGTTWTVIGERSIYLNPHGAQGNGQGEYNNALAVSPQNKNRILVGGVTLWEWSLTDGWQQIASLADVPGFPYYVHADNHNIAFHPQDANTIYVCNDGGVFRSQDNGLTWTWLVKGYITTQFYSIAVGPNGEVMGGTQDNGTIFIDPTDFLPKNGERTVGINFQGSVRDGDGGFTDLSKLNEQVQFKEMQYGVMGRSVDNGESFSAIYDFARMDPGGVAGSGSFADFVMPFLLWEKLNDPYSHDSIEFKADSLIADLGFGVGKTSFQGQFVKPRFAIGNTHYDTANVPLDGLTITAGSLVVTSDASGNLTGDGTGTFVDNGGNLTFNVTFNQAVFTEVIAKAAVNYDAGDVVVVNSATNTIPIKYTLTNGLSSGSSVQIQDPVQSNFFVGLTSRGSTGPNNLGGIWMTRDVLTNLTGTPEWFHIGDLGLGEAPQSMAVSDDGDILLVGSSAGRVYRFSNLINARDSASADIDDYQKDTVFRASTSVVQRTILASHSGRAVTSVAFHPFDKNKAMYTLGSYGNTNYIYFSKNATAPTPVFLPKDNGSSLPDFPIYSAIFNYNEPSGNQVIIGTEYGVYSTDNIDALNVVWTEENNGLPRVPVFDLIQQKTVRYDLKSETDFEGSIYAGTHGRGIFRTSTTADYVDIEEPEIEVAANEKTLNVYPNPATVNIFVELELQSRSDVQITIRDISGKLVKQVKYDKLSTDINKLNINVANLARGTYLITMSKENSVISGKFIKE